MPGTRPADEARRLRNVLTGRGRYGGCRLALAIVLAIPCSIAGLVAADLGAWASDAGCTNGTPFRLLAEVALVGVVTGGVPALVAGFRRIALLPFAIGSAGPGLIFVVLFFTRGRASDCM